MTAAPSSSGPSGGGGGGSGTSPSFPIPASLQDLEAPPYNLLPYPADFDDDDESARAESFDRLVRHLEGGNRSLASAGMGLFEAIDEDDEACEGGGGGSDAWCDGERTQALYTLVRKSDSLAPATRGRLVEAACDAVRGLCDALEATAPSDEGPGEGRRGRGRGPSQGRGGSQSQGGAGGNYVVSQAFRDALACHVYMLFTIMSLTETKEKLGKSLGTAAPAAPSSGRGKKGGSRAKKNPSSGGGGGGADPGSAEDQAASRALCARTMHGVATTMSARRSNLWIRGVPDESVAGLPCRIAYQMLEAASGAQARKACGAAHALGILARTVDSVPCLLGTVVAALVDLLHTYDHAAPLVAELCTMVNERPSNVLAAELLREIGRLDPNVGNVGGAGGGADGAGSKASGIKNVAPFLSELAAVRPRVVSANISLLLPHLDAEPYALRSEIVKAIGHILVREEEKDEREGEKEEEKEADGEGGEGKGGGEEVKVKEELRAQTTARTRESLFDVLCSRSRDVASFTRAAALRVLTDLTERRSLPLDRIMPVTSIAVDRLKDKTVVVRRCAMQLLTTLLENNPFMGMLDPELYRAKIRELEAYLKDNVPEEILKARDEALEEAKRNADDEEGDGSDGGDADKSDEDRKRDVEEIEAAALAAAVADAEAKREANEDLSEAEADFLAKVRGLKFATSALSFVEVFENAEDSFRTMLLSLNPSGVTKALQFFVKARRFGLPCAVTGTNRALSLMWSDEANMQDEVLKAFTEVFICKPGINGKEPLPENQIVQNLLDLAGEGTVSELASIKEALGRLVKKELIPPNVFSVLWTVASQAEGPPRSSAVLLISMAAAAEIPILSTRPTASRTSTTLASGTTSKSCGIGPLFGRLRAPFSASLALALTPSRPSSLVSLARGDWCDDTDGEDTDVWFCTVEQAINAIFAISLTPERVSIDILLGHQAGLFGSDVQMR
ncbi:hypothetical protein ACHAWF_011862 [Thalassiosira exigua]